jgi:regulator of sirC expression with transglutaminase-like and TPR domain
MERLVQEISGICSRVEINVKAEILAKRVLFLSFEAQTQIPQELSWDLKLQKLNEFFFDKKDFAIVADASFHDPVALQLLNRALASRVGAPRPLGLVYSSIAQKIGLNLEFVDLQPHCYLKYVDQGTSRFIDLSRRGKLMSSLELLETLQRRLQTPSISSTELLETVCHERFIIDYLVALKSAFKYRENLEPLLIIQNHILDLQPTNLPLIGERALLFKQMGHDKNALSDLKRYFAFSDRKRAPQELVKLYDELCQSLQSRSSQFELLD